MKPSSWQDLKRQCKIQTAQSISQIRESIDDAWYVVSSHPTFKQDKFFRLAEGDLLTCKQDLINVYLKHQLKGLEAAFLNWNDAWYDSPEDMERMKKLKCFL